MARDTKTLPCNTNNIEITSKPMENQNHKFSMRVESNMSFQTQWFVDAKSDQFDPWLEKGGFALASQITSPKGKVASISHQVQLCHPQHTLEAQHSFALQGTFSSSYHSGRWCQARSAAVACTHGFAWPEHKLRSISPAPSLTLHLLTSKVHLLASPDLERTEPFYLLGAT